MTSVSESKDKKNKSVLKPSASSGIQSQEDKQQDGESPQRRASIAKERQRNANHRSQSQYHTHINEKVEKENTDHRISIDTSEGGSLPLG